MAKKVKKGKPVKATKPAVKKATSKKVSKPVKKTVSKSKPKAVSKNAGKKQPKPVKKVVAKKTAPKKQIKQAVTKKSLKSTKKAQTKKQTKRNNVVTKKAVAKKTAPKKSVAKKSSKPVSKKAVVKKSATKKVAKPTKKAEIAKKVEQGRNVKKVVKPFAKVAEKSFPKILAPVHEKQIKEGKMENNNNKKQEIKPIHIQKGSVSKSDIKKDTSNGNGNNQKVRYSDTELEEFKELILKKLDEAKRDYELLKDTLSHKDDNGTDDTSPTFKLLEDGSDVLSKEETAQLAARQQKFIQNLENALIRIENKTYGICRVTGKLISKERLRSVPHATLSIEAKLGNA